MMKSTTTGTGTLTLTTAVRGFLTFALAGAVDGERLTYTIRDGANTEVGIGTYTASGTTLSRDTVLSSTNGGSAISCSGRQTVAITIAAEDIQPFAAYYYNGGLDTIANTAAANLSIDTEWVDQAGIATLAANAVTLTKKGWYDFTLVIYYESLSAFNGKIDFSFETFSAAHGYTTAMAITSDQIYISGLINASTDAYVLGPAAALNNLGASVDAYVYQLIVRKLGNQ